MAFGKKKSWGKNSLLSELNYLFREFAVFHPGFMSFCVSVEKMGNISKVAVREYPYFLLLCYIILIYYYIILLMLRYSYYDIIHVSYDNNRIILPSYLDTPPASSQPSESGRHLCENQKVNQLVKKHPHFMELQFY